LHISPNNKWIAGSTDKGDLLIWEIDTLESKLHQQGFPNQRYEITWAPKGDQFAAGGDWNKIIIGTLRNGKWQIDDKLELSDWSKDLAWSPNGKVLPIGRGDGKIDFFDTNHWKLLFTYNLIQERDLPPSFKIDIDWSPDNKYMVIGFSDGVGRILELNWK